MSAKKTKSKVVKPAQGNSAPVSTAQEYAKAGLWVAPMHGTKDGLCTCGDENCKQPGQHLRTPNGVADFTSEPEDIKELWSKCPKAKIAIEMVDELIALRVIGSKPQAALAAALTSVATVQVIDGSSSLYLWKAPIETVPTGRVRLRKGVEVLGRGEYFCAPIDLNTVGGKRRFAVDGVIGQVDIAPAPEWLLALLRPQLLGINAKPPSPGSQRVRFKTVSIDVNCIVDGNDPCDAEEVELSARSISETGPRMPPAVRRLDGGFRDDLPLYRVLTDRCQIEALKSLGATHIDCVVVDADEDGALVWQLAELFSQPQKTVLERAELGIKCVEIVRRKGGQHAQGSKPSNDKGLSTAERILGVSRRDLGRFEKIAGISAGAKEEARRAGLDDNQAALLAIAEVPAGKQVEKVNEVKVEYADGRKKRSAPKKTRKSVQPPAPGPKNQEPEHLENDDSDGLGMDEVAPPDGSTEEVDDDADDLGTQGPSILPTDDGGAPAHPDENRTKAKLQSIYDDYLAPDWPDTPPELQLWFVTEVLRVAIVNIGKENTQQ
jgi:hypothetical protein